MTGQVSLSAVGNVERLLPSTCFVLCPSRLQTIAIPLDLMFAAGSAALGYTHAAVQSISSTGAALTFLSRMVAPAGLGHLGDITVLSTPTSLAGDTETDPVPVTVYSRRGPRMSPPRCCFLLHGLSASGAADSRIVDLAFALALAGLTVVVPQVKHLQQCAVNGAVVDHVVDLLGRVAAVPDWCSNRELHLCAPCISAGLLLIAAARLPPERVAVGGVLLIGPHAEVMSVYDFVFFNADADWYGRNAIILNSFPVVPKHALAEVVSGVTQQGADIPAPPQLNVEEFSTLLRASLNDGHYGPPSAQLATALRAVSPATRANYLRLMSSPRAMKRVGDVLKTTAEVGEFARVLSPVGNVAALQCPSVVMVHGEVDIVVPSSETIRLAEHMREACKGVGEVRHLVTPLMSHGDKIAADEGSSLWALIAYVRGLVELVLLFGSFFAATMGRRQNSSRVQMR